MKFNLPPLDPAIGFKVLDVMIVLFWLFVLVDSYLQGREIPGLLSQAELPQLPVVLTAVAVLILCGIASGVTFWQRKNIMEEMPVLSTLTDRIFGEGAYHHLTHRLRPVMMSMLTSLVLGTVGFYTTMQESPNDWSYAVCIGSLLFSMTMLIAYYASRRYPPELK